MDKKKSIIVEADEATQEIMNEIGDSFTDSLDSIKDNVTDEIINRLKSFDVFKMTPEQLKKLKEDTQKLINTVSPIESGVKAQQSALASAQSAINKIETKIDNAKWADIRNQIEDLKAASENQNEQISQIMVEIGKIQDTLGIIVNLATPFWKKWRKNDND